MLKAAPFSMQQTTGRDATRDLTGEPPVRRLKGRLTLGRNPDERPGARWLQPDRGHWHSPSQLQHCPSQLQKKTSDSDCQSSAPRGRCELKFNDVITAHGQVSSFYAGKKYRPRNGRPATVPLRVASESSLSAAEAGPGSRRPGLTDHGSLSH